MRDGRTDGDRRNRPEDAEGPAASGALPKGIVNAAVIQAPRQTLFEDRHDWGDQVREIRDAGWPIACHRLILLAAPLTDIGPVGRTKKRGPAHR